MRESSDTVEVLTDQLVRLNQELRVIRNVMDEVRSDLQWGIQNGRVFLSLVDPDETDSQADAEIEGHVIDLIIRLQSSLVTVAKDIAEAVREQRSESVLQTSDDVVPVDAIADEPSSGSTTTSVPRQDQLPAITLFEAGDLVETLDDGDHQRAEVLELDDARNSATIELIASRTQLQVSQDDLRKVSPQRKEAGQTTLLNDHCLSPRRNVPRSLF